MDLYIYYNCSLYKAINNLNAYNLETNYIARNEKLIIHSCNKKLAQELVSNLKKNKFVSRVEVYGT